MKLLFLLTSFIYLNCITTSATCPKKPAQKKQAKKETVAELFPMNILTHFN